jgi:large subunit ribosomal protein L23
MNQERILKVLVAPHISEKATVVGDLNNQVVFKVLSDATKPEVRRAVETLFDVKVKAVNVVNIKGKRKRLGRTPGRRANLRKAYVTLMPGHEIDFASGAD